MMYMKYAAALAAVLPLSAAQTWSDCNPMKKSTCKPNPGLDSATFSTDFTQGSMDGWNNFGGDIKFGPDGAEFTVAKKGDSPTIETDSYFLYGQAEVVLKCAPGTGIVSSIVLESDVLDEVDWEALGGDTTQIQTNYFGKGDTSTYDRGGFSSVATPQATFHTYTINWTPSLIQWIIDGAVVRTLNRGDAKGGSEYPQTPMRLKLGIWAGGDSDNAPGTIEWAGGKTDYSQGPFTMYVHSATIQNTYPAKDYVYGDNTGDDTSILCDGTECLSGQPAPSTTTVKTTTTTVKTTTTTAKPTTTHTTTKTTETETPTTTTTKTSIKTSTTESSSSAKPTTSETSSESSGSSGSSSSSTTAASTPSPTVFPGAASALSTSSLSLVALLGLFTAMLQL